MFSLSFISIITLGASLVSGIVLPRAATHPNWPDVLEDYNVYHTRYNSLECQNKHDTPFFETCCHPLLKTDRLEDVRPAECIPAPPAAAYDDSEEDCEEDPTENSPTEDERVISTDAQTEVNKSAEALDISADVSVHTGGFATFYYQYGNAGACGTVHKDSDLIAAIDTRRYGYTGVRSSLCGKRVQITNTKNKKTVTVTIQDACPTCENGNSIDLSTGAFHKIAKEEEGIVPISWKFI